MIFLAKKSYYRLVRTLHPDRTPDVDKSEANEKFSILHQAYVILTDPEKKKLYDDGAIVLFTQPTIISRWDHFVKPITEKEIDTARKKYQNSHQKECDILREYKNGKGSMTHMINNLPFVRHDDESRVISIIMRMIQMGSAEKFKIKKLPKQ